MKHGLTVLFGSLCSTFILNLTLLTACSSADETGEQLAQRHCSNCHLFPEPALLDKKTWQQGVLPQMALRLGLVNDTTSVSQQAAQYEELERGSRLGYLPAQPVVSPQQWQRIIEYYVQNAPSSLRVNVSNAEPSLTLFKPVMPAKPLLPLTTCLRIDPQAHTVWVGDQIGGIQTLNARLQQLDSTHLYSPLTDLVRLPDSRLSGSSSSGQAQFAYLLVGLMNPNDQLEGRLQLPGPKGPDTLRRPVQMAVGDLNGDKQTDFVVCQFGNNVGQLSAFIRTGNTYRETLLDAKPGARRAIIRDCNADGRPDVVALLTQGDEQVAVYYNQPDGTFQKKTLLRFPSVHGSSYIDLADINRDGHVDIVYTNGDNADYSQIDKPYHGVHVYLNDGHFGFCKAWSYALPGAGQVLARDFDQDGDQDLAAISFFPVLSADRQQPAQVFVYFENTGAGRFQPRTWPGADVGRWLVMDAGDVDGDGDEDIVLGSSYRSSANTPQVWKDHWRKGKSGLLLLENQLINSHSSKSPGGSSVAATR